MTMKENDYLCPKCKGHLNSGGNVVFSTQNPRHAKGLILLHPTMGSYTYDHHKDYHLEKGDIIDFNCPLCLADLKSKPFTSLKSNDLLITSDTIVWFNETALGKPKNKKDAFLMLKKMSGKQHYVYTSISVKSCFFQKIFNDVTVVEFEKFTDEEINYYLEEFTPYDKAGSYGIQGYGSAFIKKIDGSYSNIVGLQMRKVYKELMKF